MVHEITFFPFLTFLCKMKQLRPMASVPRDLCSLQMPELIVKYLLSHQLHVTWLCDLSKSCFHFQFVLMREKLHKQLCKAGGLPGTLSSTKSLALPPSRQVEGDQLRSTLPTATARQKPISTMQTATDSWYYMRAFCSDACAASMPR